MTNDDSQINKGDIVENLKTGETFRVTSVVNGKLNVKGYGKSMSLSLAEVKKAPDRPVRAKA